MERFATARSMARLPWLLLALAAIDLGILVALDWYQIFGPYLIVKLEDLVHAATSVGPFLLGAGILAGAPAWPAGRGRMVIGGILVGFHGLVFALLEVVSAARVAQGPVVVDGPWQALVVILAVSSAVALVAGLLLVADGLRVSGSMSTARTATRLPMAALLALLVLATVAATVTLLGREARVADSGPMVLYGAAYRGLTTLAIVGAGLIGIVALGTSATRVAVWPVAIGAALVVAGSAWSAGASALLPIDTLSDQAVLMLTVPMALQAAGSLVMAAGFAVAALAARHERS